MYHCPVNICLVGLSDELASIVETTEPLFPFSHMVFCAPGPDPAAIARADALFVDVTDRNATAWITDALAAKKSWAKLVVIASHEQMTELADLFDAVADIWIAPLSVQEFSFRFGLWQRPGNPSSTWKPPSIPFPASCGTSRKTASTTM